MQKQALLRVEDYSEITSNFDEHIYLFHYDGIIRKMIIDYKFNEKSYLYKTFLNFLKKNEKICVQIEKYDIIMPVPISKKRLNQRGYNQSDLFAGNIARLLKIKYLKNGLLKIKNNPAQSTLSKEQREYNVKNVYKINPLLKKHIKNKKILLVDDIYTTGHTVNECSKILIKEEVSHVGILTIAKD